MISWDETNLIPTQRDREYLNMTVQDFIARRVQIEAVLDGTGKVLRAYPKNELGMTLDSIKASSEYKRVKALNGKAFAELRKLNASVSNKFKREVRDFIRAQRKQ